VCRNSRPQSRTNTPTVLLLHKYTLYSDKQIDIFLAGMHFSFSQEEMRDMFANVESLDPNMEFNYSEFLAAALHRQLVVEEERLKEAFKKLDPQCRGYLTREDLKYALGHKDCVQLVDSDSDVPADVALENKLDTIFDELDSNKDGKLACHFVPLFNT
jgi:Ca2+-binding EF-hand superfamily protein